MDKKHIDVYMPFGNSEEWVRFEMLLSKKEPSVARTYEVTAPGKQMTIHIDTD